MKFEIAPLDSYAQRITIGVAYLGGILMLPVLFSYLSALHWNGLIIPSAFAIVLALLLTLTYASQPVSYVIHDDRLVIRRRWLWSLKVPMSHITGTSLASSLANIPRAGIRFAFNPGLFGYQGPFRLEPYGEVFFMATNRERLVAVARLSAPPLILSPARPRAFVEALRESRLKATTPPDGIETKGS